MELTEINFDLAKRGERFDSRLSRHGWKALTRATITTLQINVGRLCNQACHHCHVEAGPKREEIMDSKVVDRLMEIAAHPSITTIDLTGGAPEMNPHFRELVEHATQLGKQVLVRCNLTIIEEAGYEWLPAFYAEHKIHLICSLPCYTEENVAKQRGGGVFDKSIRALQKLNKVGYGQENPNTGLQLDLVYNPAGTSLPPSQQSLETDYKKELGDSHGIVFNRLLTLANLPIGRFAQTLERNGELDPYLSMLDSAFNPATVEHLMCRNTLNVSWDGKLYDCDFNQMLQLEIGAGHPNLKDPAFQLDQLAEIPVKTGEHCLGCTAGSGSSCGGALAE